MKCEYCDKEFDGSRGVSTHQRMSDCGNSEEESKEEEVATISSDALTSASVEVSVEDDANPLEDEKSSEEPVSALENDVLERDGYRCRKCRSEEATTIHKIRPSGRESPANYKSVCAECDESLEGVHPRTKRSLT